MGYNDGQPERDRHCDTEPGDPRPRPPGEPAAVRRHQDDRGAGDGQQLAVGIRGHPRPNQGQRQPHRGEQQQRTRLTIAQQTNDAGQEKQEDRRAGGNREGGREVGHYRVPVVTIEPHPADLAERQRARELA